MYRALIVDSLTADGHALQIELEQAGVVSALSETLAQAVEDPAFKPEAILWDPAQDRRALSALQSLRQRWPDVRLVCTGRGDDGIRRLAALRAHGVGDYALLKPFDVDALMQILSDLGARAKGAAPRSHALFVDDSGTVRSFAKGCMRDQNLRVSTADSAETALERLAWDRIDAVCMDIFMPGMGGIEGIQRVREAHPEIGVVAVSGGLDRDMSFSDALTAARKIGAHRCLGKPFNATELVQAVKGAILDARRHAVRGRAAA